MVGARPVPEFDEYNRIATAGISTTERLQTMVDSASFAFLILTAEDEQMDGQIAARQKVVHEVGLFQGRLGLRRAIVMLEEGCEEFSNIAISPAAPWSTQLLHRDVPNSKPATRSGPGAVVAGGSPE